MLIDSHCHINFPELADQADLLMAQMRQAIETGTFAAFRDAFYRARRA